MANKNGAVAALVLAAGVGKRMGGNVPKQYMEIEGYPILYYTLKAFEESEVDDIILVTGAGDEAYCQKEYVEKYGFSKIRAVTAGGKERYHSVYRGLLALKEFAPGTVMIHDGARPFITQELINRLMKEAEEYPAAIIGVPVKDTIKVIDAQGYIKETPPRKCLYQIQTPQVFAWDLIFEAYEQLIQEEARLLQKGIVITDDAMVVETIKNKKIKLLPGDYNNIKITTPEDLIYGKNLVKSRG